MQNTNTNDIANISVSVRRSTKHKVLGKIFILITVAMILDGCDGGAAPATTPTSTPALAPALGPAVPTPEPDPAPTVFIEPSEQEEHELIADDVNLEFMTAQANAEISPISSSNNAAWMSGEWGVGFRLHVNSDTRSRERILNYDVDALVNQIDSIDGLSYVIMNLSQAAHGDTFLAPHSVLTVINPTTTPLNDRDLFGELVAAFKKKGIKVITYFAAQGPAMLKHGTALAHDAVLLDDGSYFSQSMENWAEYVSNAYGDTSRETYKRAYGEIILEEYAARYGNIVDGWWIDNGEDNYDIELLTSILRRHSPNSAISSGANQVFDFRNGHPTPVARTSPSSEINKVRMLHPMEATFDGFTAANGMLHHIFMPIHEKWNSGDIVFTVDQGADWMERAINAGGAWTWNVDMDDAASVLRVDTVELIKEIKAKLDEPNVAPKFKETAYFAGTAEVGVAFSGSVAGFAADADGDPVTYLMLSNGYWRDGDYSDDAFVSDNTDWLTASPDGRLVGTPPLGTQPGMHRYTILAEDGRGNIDKAELEVLVLGVAVETNHTPYFSLSHKRVKAVQDFEYEATLSDIGIEAIDLDANDEISYSFVWDKSWINITENGTITASPTAAHIGWHTLMLKATDSSGAIDTMFVQLKIVETE